MGRHSGSGVRGGATSLRVAAVAGMLVLSSVAVAVPAVAEPSLVEDTPCTTGARACVDLAGEKAWLIGQDDKVTRGPVRISSGGPGKETPVGDFVVQWKDKNHTSSESRDPKGQPAAMPYSVFFADGGVAFHGGSIRRLSAGCVHLKDEDAVAFYDTLQLGDKVQVH